MGSATIQELKLQVGEDECVKKKASAEKTCDGAEAGSAVVPGLGAIL